MATAVVKRRLLRLKLRRGVGEGLHPLLEKGFPFHFDIARHFAFLKGEFMSCAKGAFC